MVSMWHTPRATATITLWQWLIWLGWGPPGDTNLPTRLLLLNLFSDGKGFNQIELLFVNDNCQGYKLDLIKMPSELHNKNVLILVPNVNKLYYVYHVPKLISILKWGAKITCNFLIWSKRLPSSITYFLLVSNTSLWVHLVNLINLINWMPLDTIP